ncbi:hypothetical protein JTB14_028666 [Gonioctena quinquepunctata]|nr:hypothetical protein JTB14_028666 [Gonioctena quinquepunctata]
MIPSVYDIHKEEYEGLSYGDLCDLALKINEKLSREQCQNILLATVKQNKLKECFNQRAGRITASNFMRACETSFSKPSLSLIKTICYPLEYQFKSKATEWGLHHEDDALQAYKQMENHTHLKVEKAEFHVDPNDNYLGAHKFSSEIKDRGDEAALCFENK